MRFERVEIGAGAEQKNAAVPIIVAGGEIGFGGRAIRLLDEAVDPGDAGYELGAALDIALARFRTVRRDAEGGEPALLDQRPGGVDRGAEGWHVADDMIARHHQHDRVAIKR